MAELMDLLAGRGRRYRLAFYRGYDAQVRTQRDRNPYSPKNPSDRKAWFAGFDKRAADIQHPAYPLTYTKHMAACVRFGAELLDRQMPGWHEKINLSTLRLSDCVSCVLGQLLCLGSHELLFDFFPQVAKKLGLSPEDVTGWRSLEPYGFAISPEFLETHEKYIMDRPLAPRYSYMVYWHHLTDLWKAAIRERLEVQSNGSN